MRLWDTATGTLLHTLTGHTSSVGNVVYSLDGRTLVSGSGDNTVRIWDATTGTLKHTLIGHTSSVRSVAYSPDGNTIASGSEDNTVRIWDATTGTLKHTLRYTSSVRSVAYSPDGNTIASGSYDGTVLLWRLTPMEPDRESEQLVADINADGTINIQDLAFVAARFGQTGEDDADVNGDGEVNIKDLVLVAAAFGNGNGAPTTPISLISGDFHIGFTLTRTEIQQWLVEARQLGLTDPTSLRGIAVLEQLFAALAPAETALLPNYPNPFNPETWIPYQLAVSASVSVSIYAADGTVVSILAVGHQPAGEYQQRNRAVYWDGRNTQGEPVASGVYFYTLTAGDFTATRKMIIRK